MRTLLGLAKVLVAAVAIVTATVSVSQAQDESTPQTAGKVFTELTTNWGSDARLMLAEMSALPSRVNGPADTKLPSMGTYMQILDHLQNLRTHTDIAVDSLYDAPPAASIGPRNTKMIGKAVESIGKNLQGPIKALYLAQSPDEADAAVQRAIGVLTKGLQTVPEL